MLPKRKGDILKFHSNAPAVNFLDFEDYTCEICYVLLKLRIPSFIHCPMPPRRYWIFWQETSKKTWIGKKWNQRPIWESEEMLHNKNAKEILQQMASRMNPSQKVGLVHTAATIREDLKGKYSFIDNFQLFSFIHHFCCVKNVLTTCIQLIQKLLDYWKKLLRDLKIISFHKVFKDFLNV